MKKALQVSALILLYILFSAKSCSREEEYNAIREEKIAGTQKDSLLAVFCSDSPTLQELTAYEAAAKERFSDFLDYSEIISDTLKAKAFRDQAATMVRTLFVSGSTILLVSPGKGKPVEEISLADLTDTLVQIPLVLRISRPGSIRVVSPLKPVNDSLFRGKLGFTVTTDQSITDPVRYLLAGSMMDFFLVKSARTFGPDTLKVWTILLGDVR